MTQNRRSRPVFPVDLLVEGRRFLVVGGGKVARRKARGLLEAGADVTVVSPEACDDILRLAEEGKITHVPRRFADSDADGVFLVFAATDDGDANHHVLDCCRARGILCCPVDSHWSDGDFLTPATFRKNGLTVSVSTGGRSCRRSRLIKGNLSRHLRIMETADLLVMGISHRCLTVEEREPYHLTGERMDRTGEMLTQVLGVHEFMLLDTCNRVELIAAVSDEPGMDALLERILGFDGLPDGGCYTMKGLDAFGHVAAVAAGLLSQSPGEDHIVAQVKEALRTCEAAGWAGGVMRGWLGCVLRLSRDIRAATAPLLKGGEIEDICLEYLRTARPPSEGLRVLVLGTGTVGRGMVEGLVRLGYRCDWCFHVNRPDLPEAWKKLVEVHPLAELGECLAAAGAVICAAAGAGHVLDAGHAELFGRDKTTLVFDLGIPRNVNPALDGLAPGLEVIGLDDLKQFSTEELADVERALELAGRIVEEHREMYDRIVESLQGRDAAQ